MIIGRQEGGRPMMDDTAEVFDEVELTEIDLDELDDVVAGSCTF
jgi:hypothetical protein